MINVHFVLVSPQGRQVMEFDTAEQARIWAELRNAKVKKLSMCVSQLILVKKTTTVVEEILDYI